MRSFVLKGTVCWSRDPQTLTARPGAWLVCQEGLCQGVFDTLPEEYAHLPVTDYGDALILPGLVDLHIHAPQYPFRGTGMDQELMDWLRQEAFPEEARYADPDYARRAYNLFARGLKESATTRACVFATLHREATALLMEELESTGLVTYVGKVNMDQPAILREPDAQTSLRETLAWLEETRGRFRRTFPILTPRFLPSCSEELLDSLQAIQEDWGLPVQSHLSENQGEISFVKARFPWSAFYGAAYDHWGLFGRSRSGQPVPTIMAHCVWSPPEEVALLKDNGVFVAHCPASNTNLASGIAPVRRYLEAGLRVGLGSDVAGGHTVSLFRAMADAVQVSKLHWRLVDQADKPLTFPEAFWLATRGGGAFFGSVGAFEPGYELDALVLEAASLPSPRPLTALQRLERAVYLSLDQTGLAAKYVQGRQVL